MKTDEASSKEISACMEDNKDVAKEEVNYLFEALMYTLILKIFTCHFD